MSRVLVVNSSFGEMDHLAAGLARAGLLSAYVRPYANLGRLWERCMETLGLGRGILGRRALPQGLQRGDVLEAGLLPDLALAAALRLPGRVRELVPALARARTRAAAAAGARAYAGEDAVVASWGCAEPAFERARARGAMCVLNYSLAHHRFTRRLLLEEARREPAFASTLNSHDWPAWLEQRFDAEIAMADRILVGSSFARDSFVAEGVPADKVVVVPYGADMELFSPAYRAPREGFNVLFVGQISQRKGISYLLRAYQRFHAPGTFLTLVGRIQGDGAALAPYRGLFWHVPHVPRTELKELYRAADVFVFPTLVEGMGLVVLEAMASGLPVIVTPRGPGDIVRDGVDGFVVPAGDADALAQRMTLLREDQDLRARMAFNSRSRALQYPWRCYRKRTLRLIDGWLQGQWTASRT